MELTEAESTASVLKYAHGARNECVHGTSLDTRTAHAANASERMRRSSGERTTARCRNQKTTVGMKVVCEEAPKDPLERKDLERWNTGHLEFVAKVPRTCRKARKSSR